MTTPILYSFRRCPYAIRARFGLKYAQISCRIREVQLKNKPSSLIKFSPKATVPVLVLENNKIIDESLDIIRWALNQHDPENYLNKTNQDNINNLIKQNDKYFAQILTYFKYPNKNPNNNYEFISQKVHEHLIFLDAQIKTHKFLITSHPTIADIAVFPFVRQRARINQDEFEKTPYKNLHNWLEFFYQHPIYTQIMQKFPVWHEGHPEVIL